MRRPPASSITELPASPEEEQRGRVLRYSIAMGVRMLCIVACVFVHGWWLVIPAVGAIVLPYFAVLIANAHIAKPAAVVERPGAIVPVAPSVRREGPR
ncbi:DUF3099 domain-containing protein [Homoserinibacter sp. YIM 151385]|uniref:DUF3099 domain-containing protein n=1 Tax=Homoserinibacter sp. YIM 151385 TaxID=2985506 RepID=UPI0022F0EF86|nr:DUF3099 domain-containing protein [Homoserinibacter sp. YIM 151385]WBU38585.1 DUF3099 domain-containing protein [Homoserinibacter sp. YIM 151385]